MKKNICILVLLCFIFLSGCNKKEYFTCEIDLYNNLEKYSLSAIYKVHYKDTYVTRIEQEEIYTTENEDTLNYFKESKKLEYTNMNDVYGGVNYSLDLQNNKIILKSTISMKLVDIKKMLKNNYLDKNYVVSNKLTVSGIKDFYKKNGAVCDI